MPIVILQGPSGAGKTYLAQKLSKDLNVPYIGKDTVKELLFDTIGLPGTREENYAYGRIAIATLFKIIQEFQEADKALIADCAFYAKEAADDLKAHAINTDHILQLYLTATPQVLLERFNGRIARGERHKGHGDIVKDDISVFVDYSAKYQPLEIPNTITVDTAQLDEKAYITLKDKVALFLKSSV